MQWQDKLSAQERLELAKAITGKVVDHLGHLIALHESNRQLVFSDVVAKQITRSHAANTFNLLRDSQFRYEVIRLCALWDPPSAERESICTIAALVDNPAVVDLVAEEARARRIEIGEHILGNPDEQLREFISRIARAQATREGEESAIRSSRQVRRACWNTRKLRASVKLRALRDFRDHHLAHSLADGSKRSVPQATPHYGDERRLLKVSIATADRFYLGLCGTGFMWDGLREMHQRDADLFWHGIKVDILG